MAKKASSKSIGEVSIDVTANTEQAVEGMQEVQNVAENMASGVDTEAQRASGSVRSMSRNMTDSLSKAAGPMLGLLGSVTALVGVFKLAFNAGKKFGDMLVGTKAETEQLEEATRNLSSAFTRHAAIVKANLPEGFVGDIDRDLERLQTVREEVSKLGALLSKLQTSRVAQFTTIANPAELQQRFTALVEEEKNLLAATASLHDRARVQRRETEVQEAQKASKDRTAQINEEARQLEESVLDPILRARRELDRLREGRRGALRGVEGQGERDAIKRRTDAQVAAQQKTLRDLIEADRKARELDAKRLADKEKREREAAQRIARAAASALASGFNRENNRLEQQMGRLVIAAERMLSTIERIKGRINP